LRNLEIALRNFRITKTRANLEIARPISRLRKLYAHSRDCVICTCAFYTAWALAWRRHV
jgi:hypothetical protein